MKLRFFWQLIELVAGLLYTSVWHNGHFPDKDTYKGTVEYSLPFTGKWVVVNGGVDKETSHAWNIYPERYAYDFLILDETGASFTGDERALSSYYCYGKEVLAPADGIVVTVYDRIEDSRIVGNGQTDKTAVDLTGNRVVIRHAENEFSTVCHLMPRSITVQPGQRVSRGEVIARCGNSGNSTEPHIHFQLQSKKDLYTSVGLPIRFKSIRINPTPNYEKADPRPIPSWGDLESGYIVRGMSVENGV